jgi:putative DNA primase/helicase
MPGLNQSSASGGRIPFKTINEAALRASRSLLPQIIPGGKFRSLEYIVRNPRRDDKHAGSFKINYRTGVWKDFATGDGGGDLISLVAYVRGCSNGDAALELADKLGVPLLTPDDKPNGRSAPTPPLRSIAEAPPKVFTWGDAGPPVSSNEVRRHVYPASRRVKIKSGDGRWVNWYRVFSNDGAPIGWQAKKPDDYTPVPYVTSALDPFDPELRDDYIHWTEGEKDVDGLNKLNLPAFTFGGVGDGLPDGVEHFFNGRHIAILADNDDPGRKHAGKKAPYAHNAGAASVRIVHFPELPAKGDVSDFIEAGGTAEQLYARIEAAHEWMPPHPDQVVHAPALVMQRACDVEAKPIEWLWPGRIAIGKQTMLAGEPGLGKSQLSAFLAATVTTGGHWPNGEGRAELGSVIVLSAEDDAADTIIPRLKAAGTELSRVHVVSAVSTDDHKGRRLFNLQSDLAILEDAIARVGDVRLVIIDPVSSYLGKVDSHKNAEVRTVLEPIGEMASRLRVAVVAVTHFSKGGGSSANHRIIGSIAFVAAARAAFIVSRDPGDENRRLFLPSKNNLGPDRDGLAFRIETRLVGEGIIAPAVSWDSEPVTRTADEILAAVDKAGHYQSATDEAVDWLRELLGDGPLPAKQVRSEGDAAGHSWATIRRAKKAVGVEAFREGGMAEAGRWLWRLPGAESLRGSTNPYPAQQVNVSALDEVGHLSSGSGDGDPSVMARTTSDTGATDGGHL